jgi:hypothetical protein
MKRVINIHTINVFFRPIGASEFLKIDTFVSQDFEDVCEWQDNSTTLPQQPYKTTTNRYFAQVRGTMGIIKMEIYREVSHNGGPLVCQSDPKEWEAI